MLNGDWSPALLLKDVPILLWFMLKNAKEYS